MVAFCAGQVVAEHDQSWTAGAMITDPQHRATAKLLRAELAERRADTPAAATKAPAPMGTPPTYRQLSALKVA
ncbi:hypothetical protein [Dactylosporangium sp. CA-233914]|uniref:hypothetical protein n=1 Tax=Dactylosporangium sp. CA-233914 TaxID=3239934 RepID=UPI003D8DCBBE